MTDIVERLRDYSYEADTWRLQQEAADEIERLRSERDDARRLLEQSQAAEMRMFDRAEKAEQERDALQERWKQFEEYDCDELKAAYALVEKVKQERDALAATVERLRDVLETANNGLNWYRDRHPESISGCDYEADEQISAALAADPATILATRDARVKAEALRKASKAFNDPKSWFASVELRLMADAIEKGGGK